jgi:hypothetical protein
MANLVLIDVPEIAAVPHAIHGEHVTYYRLSAVTCRREVWRELMFFQHLNIVIDEALDELSG